jgi:hypothetical protein
MWNRAETIVKAWNPAIAAAVTIVGTSRPRTAGPASSSPPSARAVSPMCVAR